MAGRTQQQLARAIGLHPAVLSHKLNGHDGAMLTTLAAWGALVSRFADGVEFVDLTAVSDPALLGTALATAWAWPRHRPMRQKPAWPCSCSSLLGGVAVGTDGSGGCGAGGAAGPHPGC